MSGACAEHVTMETATFAAHVEELGTKIKDKVAKLAANTVLEDSVQAKQAVQSAIDNENRQRHAEAMSNGGPYTPMEMPADNGYSLLHESWREVVDDYRENYEIDLLTFDAARGSEAEEALKNEHLTWIVDLFSRGGNLPKPQLADSPIASLEGLAGSGEVLAIGSPANGTNIDVDDAAWGDGSFGSVVESDIGTIQDAIKPWDSGSADVFRTIFLPKVPIAAANQVDVMRAMRNLLGAHQGLLLLGRGSIDGIAHDTIEVLDSFDECCSGGVSLQTVLGVAAGVVAIAGGIAGLAAGGSGAALIGAGIGILGGAIGTAKTLDGAINGDGTMGVAANHELGGDSVEDVVDNLREAVETTYADLDEGYTELAGGMSALQGLMTGSPTEVRAPRPGGSDGEPGLLDTDQGNVVTVAEG